MTERDSVSKKKKKERKNVYSDFIVKNGLKGTDDTGGRETSQEAVAITWIAFYFSLLWHCSGS